MSKTRETGRRAIVKQYHVAIFHDTRLLLHRHRRELRIIRFELFGLRQANRSRTAHRCADVEEENSGARVHEERHRGGRKGYGVGLAHKMKTRSDSTTFRFSLLRSRAGK